jgi:hypothetical protein
MRGIRIILGISAFVAVAAGLFMMFAATSFLTQQGLPSDDHIAVLARAQASLLLAIGVTNVLAIRAKELRELLPVLGGNVVAHVTALGVNAHALGAGLVGQQVYVDVGMHIVLGALFATYFFKAARS